MSKEKQKFFRFSAFNLVKKRRCRGSSSEWEGWGGVRVTRVQQVELRLGGEGGEGSDTSSERSVPAAAGVTTVFERIAAETASTTAWGFAAEAQKQTAPTKITRTEPVTARRRSKCGERLLTTLFDGLSEFYSVRNTSRSQSRPRVPDKHEPIDSRREVLKETRSTFRQYQASLVKPERRSPLHKRPYERNSLKDEIRTTYSYNSYDHFRSESPVDKPPRLTVSQLVKHAAFGSSTGDAQLRKLFATVQGARQQSLAFDFHRDGKPRAQSPDPERGC